jgi:hypothetical protein
MKTLHEYFNKCYECINFMDKPTYGNCPKKLKDIIDLTPQEIDSCIYHKEKKKMTTA